MIWTDYVLNMLPPHLMGTLVSFDRGPVDDEMK